MTRPSTPVQDLPADLADRLRRLAEDQTAGSRPWPRVDQALRRNQRRRLAGLSAVTAVGVVIAGVAYAGLIEPTTRSEPASTSDSQRRESLAELRKAGYGSPTAGSLAGDPQWLAQVRRRAAELVPLLPDGGGRGDVVSADEVLLPWTGEREGNRYAIVVYPGQPQSNGPGRKPTPTFAAAVLVGERAEEMTIEGIAPWAESYGQSMPGQLLWAPADDPDNEVAAQVFALGPTVTGVRVATDREFIPDGGPASTEWRPLSREGGVWLGRLNQAEVYLSDVQLEGTGNYSSSVPPESPVIHRFRAIGPAGTDLAALDCASRRSTDLGGAIGDQPVLAATTPLTSTSTLAAAVQRDPHGPLLVTFCTVIGPGVGQRTSTSVGAAFRAPADPDTFLAAIEDQDDTIGPGGYLVVAPAGATTVTMGAETAKVTNRLASFSQSKRTGPQTVRALDRNGTVIATTRSVLGQ